MKMLTIVALAALMELSHAQYDDCPNFNCYQCQDCVSICRCGNSNDTPECYACGGHYLPECWYMTSDFCRDYMTSAASTHEYERMSQWHALYNFATRSGHRRMSTKDQLMNITFANASATSDIDVEDATSAHPALEVRRRLQTISTFLDNHQADALVILETIGCVAGAEVVTGGTGTAAIILEWAGCQELMVRRHDWG